MRILFVASYNKNRFAAFITEQADALRKHGLEVDFFGIQGKGIKGYLQCLPMLKECINTFKPDIIHAHYGLSGLLANLQRNTPVVTTYHGSDINDPKVLKFSKLCMRLSKHNIFVSQKNVDIANPPKQNFTLLPCGVDLNTIQPTDKSEAQAYFKWQTNGPKKILFAGAFDNHVKNPELAFETMKHLNISAELIELKGYSRKDIGLLFSAADAFLMTSYTEGSPQVVKEAMACGCPIVSVDVGDVKERIDGIKGCYVSNNRKPETLANLLTKCLNCGRTDGRAHIIALGLDNDTIAERLIKIYNMILL